MSAIPSTPGSYILLFRVANEEVIRVGRLGELKARPGMYLYFGSAFGPGGLRARMGHHLGIPSHPHWHLDWLRGAFVPTMIWWAEGPERLECTWAAGFARCSEAETPLAGFGASDCRRGCPAHFLFFGTMDGLFLWRSFVEETIERLSGPGFDRFDCDLPRPVDEKMGARRASVG